MELSPELDALFAQAIEAAKGPAPAVPQQRQERDALLDRAMLAGGFPRHGLDRRATPPGHPMSSSARIVYRASSLTPTQRAVAAFVARHPALPTGRFPLPGSPWAIRRWLGIDDPGVLFQERSDGRTPYEVLRSFDRHDESFDAYLSSLPWGDQVQALTDLALITTDCNLTPTNHLHALLTTRELGGGPRTGAGPASGRKGNPNEPTELMTTEELGAWALARSQWLVDQQSRAPLPGPVLEAVLPVIYVALAHAGLSNRPEFDALLPLGRWNSVSEEWLAHAQRALVDALPEERREAALLGAMNNVFESDRVLALQRLLPFYPYPALAHYILEHAHEANPARALETVRKAAAASADIAALYEAHMTAIGSVPGLRATSLTQRPSLSALTEAQKDQLCTMGRWWTGAVGQTLATDPRDERSMSLIVIESDEGAAFEAWLNQLDEGSIFRAGTSEQVAWMGQGGLPECEDRALLTALREALTWRHLDALRELDATRGADGAQAEGPWATYGALRGLCEERGGSPPPAADDSGDDDVPF